MIRFLFSSFIFSELGLFGGQLRNHIPQQKQGAAQSDRPGIKPQAFLGFARFNKTLVKCDALMHEHWSQQDLGLAFKQLLTTWLPRPQGEKAMPKNCSIFPLVHTGLVFETSGETWDVSCATARSILQPLLQAANKVPRWALPSARIGVDWICQALSRSVPKISKHL